MSCRVFLCFFFFFLSFSSFFLSFLSVFLFFFLSCLFLFCFCCFLCLKRFHSRISSPSHPHCRDMLFGYLAPHPYFLKVVQNEDTNEGRVCFIVVCWIHIVPATNRLSGLVVKASASGAEDPGFESCLTAIFRLRTGHCGLRAHLKRIGIMDSALCDCKEAEQTVHHILQDCPIWRKQRHQLWPQDESTTNKLWGTAEDLRRTTQFLTTCGLRV